MPEFIVSEAQVVDVEDDHSLNTAMEVSVFTGVEDVADIMDDFPLPDDDETITGPDNDDVESEYHSELSEGSEEPFDDPDYDEPNMDDDVAEEVQQVSRPEQSVAEPVAAVEVKTSPVPAIKKPAFTRPSFSINK